MGPDCEAYNSSVLSPFQQLLLLVLPVSFLEELYTPKNISEAFALKG